MRVLERLREAPKHIAQARAHLCLDLLDGGIRFRALRAGEVPVADEDDRGLRRALDVIFLRETRRALARRFPLHEKVSTRPDSTGTAALGRSTVKTHPVPGMLRTSSEPPLASTPRWQIARPRPRPVRSPPRCSNGRNRARGSPGGRPPHSSSTSIRTRSASADDRSDTCPPGGVNLNAF